MKKIFSVIFLYLFFILLLIGIFLIFISNLTDILNSSIQSFRLGNNISYLNNIYLLIAGILIVFLSSLILFFVFKRNEKYINIATGIFIFFTIAIGVYFYLQFSKNIIDFKEVKDSDLITKYQNIEVKNENNLYYFIKSLSDKNYNENGTLFGKYKKNLISTKENIENLGGKDFIYGECYLEENKTKGLCTEIKDISKINSLLPSYIENKISLVKILNNNSIYKNIKGNEITGISTSGLLSSNELRLNKSFIITELKKGNNDKIIDYFNNYYKFYLNIINGDCSMVDYIISITGLAILNNQLEYFLTNGNLTNIQLNSVKNILLKNQINDSFNNVIKNEYKIAIENYLFNEILKDENISKNNNFIFDYNKTKELFKNIYYYGYIKGEDFSNLREKSLNRYNILGNILASVFLVDYSQYKMEIDNFDKKTDELKKLLNKKIMQNNLRK